MSIITSISTQFTDYQATVRSDFECMYKLVSNTGPPAYCFFYTESSHSEIFLACQSLNYSWRDFGTRIGVFACTLDTIEADCNNDVKKCIFAVVNTWLKRSLGQVCVDVKPTWRSLCLALSTIDRTLAKELAEKHDCKDYSVSGTSIDCT